MNQKKRLSVKTVVLIGMFGALAAVLETFQIPVPFAPPFYKLDFAETPIMMRRLCPGTGPCYPHGAGEEPAEDPDQRYDDHVRGRPGELHRRLRLCASSLHSVPEAPHQEDGHGRPGTFRLTGVLTAIVVNCFLTLPLYANLMFGGIENIISMGTAINPAITNLPTFAVFAIVPFNLLKLGMNAGITALVYKKVSVILHVGAPVREPRTSVEKG